MTAGAELVHVLTLEELAETANNEHRLVFESLGASFEHAVRCGEALLAAKALVDPGGWLAWLDANFTERSNTTAQQYMRVAEFQDVLREAGATQNFHRAREASRHLGLGRQVGQSGRKNPSEKKRLALQLKSSGATVSAISEVLDVSTGTVSRWTNPESARRQDELGRRRYRQRAAARKALAAQQRDEAVKKALVKEGQAMNEAYRLITRLDQLLGQARSEAQDAETRLAINEAHAHRDKMMDALIKALGVS